jgi:energy-converting hydrogenase Eha subunit H
MVTGQGCGMGIGGCNRLCPATMGHTLVALVSPFVSIKDHSLRGPWSSHRLIISSTYLLMGAGRLVTL